MSDEDLKPLAAIARAREAERAAWEASPEAAHLTAPLDDAERARLLRAVLPGAKPEPTRPRLFAWAGGLATATAVAVLALVITSSPALPRYALEVPTLGYSAVRGEAPPAKVLTLTPGMALDVVLRPASDVKGELAARSFVETAKGRQSVEWPVEVAPTGAVRFSGRVGERPALPAGASRLVLVVGRPAEVARWAEGGTDEGALVVFRVNVVVRE